MTDTAETDGKRHVRAMNTLDTILSNVRDLKGEQRQGSYLLWELHELEGRIMSIIDGMPNAS